ncbi:Oligo-1,6-glucosidase [Rhodobacteraceae bacterium THAF1]|uniref:alpha-glucosidase n=1 Tax=Palleronia sp. THAF1 TaxID=2587842 RepID=UPI000F3C9CBE|nr:alpha-glucosidase [Palleronia sp. THAF1]QFU08053.1 Oligo-1,6-glucosidase [Palleronia sp. THAF1]VDC27908.1 Oligo-1,6-glucosidase [Rhodobacteraceae bacterium THAF1]
MTDPWWKHAVGYQIWPRSFQDSVGDGIGDIPGIISRLDHLADLGIGFIWLSPVYASPQRDMGYDIADYRAIAPEYGTMDDMDRLIAEADERGIRIVMDLVVNHTSDQHHWFRRAVSDPNSPERDYYIWRDQRPSNLRACFGGPAWVWNEAAGQHYLGYFSAHQPDLNWQNPALREEIWDMMRWWFDRGIGGFRMDVISLIGKDVDAEVFEEGPDLHPFLQEMHREVLAGRDVVSIGESWSVSPETAPLYCGKGRDELSMVFQFNHIKAGWDDIHGKWKPKPRDVASLVSELFTWQKALADDGWNSLFLSNHDLPRQVSKYGDGGAYRARSAKALATVVHLMKGTPFVYQGEEIGMTNVRFDRLEQFRDLETLGHWDEERTRGVDWAAFLSGANENGRDNARTPVQWSDAPGAGFTDGTPWIEINPNARDVNVADDSADPDGVMATYRSLIALRRDMAVVREGRFDGITPGKDGVVAYTRTLGDQRLSVLANLSGESVGYDVPSDLAVNGRCVLHNAGARRTLTDHFTLLPWEAVAIIEE